MIVLVSSKIDSANIKASLGRPEYSYYFLLKEFLPALHRIAKVIQIGDTEEIDRLYEKYQSTDEFVVFLSFSPPHQTPVGLKCPTICVFAWEFNNIPEDAWDSDPRNDWRYVFEKIEGAITLSEEAALAVKKSVENEFLVTAIPAPVYDQFANFCPEKGWQVNFETKAVTFTGELIDSHVLGLSADGLVQQPSVKLPEFLTQDRKLKPSNTREKLKTTHALLKAWWTHVAKPFLRPYIRSNNTSPVTAPIETGPQINNLELSGVIYTSVLNPGDNRKNWIDLISGFCWEFKNVADATLILKMTHYDHTSYHITLMTLLSRLAPFKCRVVVIQGFLEESEYQKLIAATAYYVNTSACEGLCLPLMEFLSAGKPAIAPKHTAMLDYITKQIAFIVESARQPTSWPHDPTGKWSAYLHRLNWQSLISAYRESYSLIKNQPEDYSAMSKQASEKMKQYCALDKVTPKLLAFICQVEEQLQSVSQ